MSGYSSLFSKTLHKIAKINEAYRPCVIIITAAPWLKVFEKYEYISIANLKHKRYDLEDWNNYNYALLDIMPIITAILAEIKAQVNH